MADFISRFFITPDSLPDTGYGFFQVVFLGAAYGYVLFSASSLISDGSELLLLVPSMAGLVGSVVLPILGAVPDGAIVLFSGLGPDAQKQLSVGVGALAGSTIMLLTIPWCLSVIGGRVNFDGRMCTYKRPARAAAGWAKLNPAGNSSLTGTAVECLPPIKTNGKIMMLTALTYLIIQLPAFYTDGEPAKTQRKSERWFAFSGMVVSVFCFFAYLLYQFQQAKKDAIPELGDLQTELRKEAVRKGELTIRGAMHELFLMSQGTGAPQPHGRQVLSQGMGDSRQAPLLSARQMEGTHSCKHQMRELLRPFYHKLDKDGNGKLDKSEVKVLFYELNEHPSDAELTQFFHTADADESGYIEMDEFVTAMSQFVASRGPQFSEAEVDHPTICDDEEEEEEEIPEDLADLTPEQQQKRIKMRALWMCSVGTVLVLIFSDPMVDVFSNIGERIGVSPFYISFVLAPLASNASELIASYKYSLKKTRKTITISFSALEGAAIMNNTFCLGIFLALVYFKSLIWTFSAETIAILLVQLVMFFFCLKKVQRLLDGLLVICLYPISIAVVLFMENYLGFD